MTAEKTLPAFICSFLFLLLFAHLAAQPALSAGAEGPPRLIGVAKVDVTPSEPIRLTGFASRKTNSTGVEQKLWAKALAIGSDAENPAVLMTLDNCGIAEITYRELAQRLEKKAGLKPDRLAVSCSHTHCGPCTTDWAPNIFAQDIPSEQQATIDRYTRELTDKLEKAALAALKDRRTGRLAWSQGRAGFARNRRVVQGSGVQFGDNSTAPVDQSLPVLLVTDEKGQVRALVANYACHCTTIGGEFNKLCGDWAGFAQEYLERDHPGAVALITIGCGADANPFPRGGADGGLGLARQHGEEIAAEVKRLLTQNFIPLTGKLSTRIKHIELPFGPHFTHAQWEERAQKPGIVGYHAKKYLARLDRGEKLPEDLSYYVGTWNFGDELAMVFLSGEVVVDYALRLKQDYDPQRLWVTGYANYVPCYIPSRRILREGGYEAEESLWYYDRPARISTNAEELIIKTVHELVPKSFLLDKKRAEFPPPKTAEEALASFRTKANFIVELAAAEPLIESPVAIDWGADGRLWVCEMYDYPSGVDGKWKPGGRVKVLQDPDSAGRYRKAKLFLDGLPFPTGIMAWGKGALICAAPDILYAEDTDGDGKADVVKKLYSGFATHNFQARVNGLSWGLDGWVYGASGLFGGKVKSLLTGKEVDLSGRDFRIKPDTGEIEPVSGISQQGRIRDDWGNWFGNDNSTLLWNFPLPDHYLRRNPYVTYPDPRVNVAAVGMKPRTSVNREERSSVERVKGRQMSMLAPAAADPNQLYPVSRTLERFNDPQSANHTTSACGPEIYRDVLLGENYSGNAFICEPVHNLVTRLVLEPDGAAFVGGRAADEEHSEFLASTDNWFRPVQLRTGPDGALWVVDMYRFVIEHPRWIPPERLKQLDPRAGADKGRIYRIYPRGAKLRPIPDLTKFTSIQLAQALNSPNGAARDRAHVELVKRAGHIESGKPGRKDVAGRGDLAAQLPVDSALPAVRAQVLWILQSLGRLTPEQLQASLHDSEPSVRRAAVQLSEPFLNSPAEAGAGDLRKAVLKLAEDSDPGVRFQLALSLGACKSAEAGQVLGQLAKGSLADSRLKAAVLSSAAPHAAEIFAAIVPLISAQTRAEELMRQLIATAVGNDYRAEVGRMLQTVSSANATSGSSQTFLAVSSLFDGLERQHLSWENYFDADTAAEQQKNLIRKIQAEARVCAQESEAQDATRDGESTSHPRALLGRGGEGRLAAIALLGHESTASEKDVQLLLDLLVKPSTRPVQSAAMEALKHFRKPEIAVRLIGDWLKHSPAARLAIVDLLMVRPEWVDALLQAIEQGKVSPAEISLPNRQRLLKQSSVAIRERAEEVFAGLGSGSRAELVNRYRSVLSLTAAPERGAEHFEKNCSTCHAYRGHGHSVGPNLAEFAGKSVEDFLVAILDPNAAINPNFLAYNLETKDGRSLTGIVKGETASSLTLAQGGGLVENILRSDLQEIRASQVSLMPEGLDQAMTPQDLADLIAWLKQGASPLFGSASAEQAARARAEFLKSGANGVAKIVSASEQLNYPSWLGRLPLFHCRQTDGTSRLVWETGRVASDLSASAAQTFRLPAAMGFLSQPAGKFRLAVNGKQMLDFDVSLSDQSWQSEDGRVRLLYTVMEHNAEDSNGLLVIEVAGGLLEPGKPASFEVAASAAQSQRWFGIYLLDEQFKP